MIFSRLPESAACRDFSRSYNKWSLVQRHEGLTHVERLGYLVGFHLRLEASV